MKNLLFLSILVTIIITSCSKNESDINKNSELTIAYFETHLNAAMNYQALVATFGHPHKDIGSGIHIYVYVLVDTTEVWIGYTDKIMYARHMDSKHQLIKILI